MINTIIIFSYTLLKLEYFKLFCLIPKNWNIYVLVGVVSQQKSGVRVSYTGERYRYINILWRNAPSSIYSLRFHIAKCSAHRSAFRYVYSPASFCNGMLDYFVMLLHWSTLHFDAQLSFHDSSNKFVNIQEFIRKF